MSTARNNRKAVESIHRRLLSAREAEFRTLQLEYPEVPAAVANAPRTVLSQVEHVWRAEFAKAFPGVPLAKHWGGKEYGQAKSLLERYDLQQLLLTVEYVIRNWSTVRYRYTKDRGGSVPAMGFLLSFHETLVAEAYLAAQPKRVPDF
jgi:hypothetical protein